jgi:hypothetical protein
MTTIVGRRPPATQAPAEKPKWVELVRLRHPAEVQRLLKRLENDGIETKTTTGVVADARGKLLRAEVVFVPRAEIEGARFVVLQISFEGPSTDEVHSLSMGARRMLAAALAGTVFLIALLFEVAPSSSPAPREPCKQQIPWARNACESNPTP